MVDVVRKFSYIYEKKEHERRSEKNNQGIGKLPI